MTSSGSKDKFIAFLDIVGFKSLVENSELGAGMPLTEIQDAVTALGTAEDQAHFQKYGPTICPRAPKLTQDIDFRVTPASDCAIISAEISPAGVINLIAHCATACFALLTKGLMIRGYVTRGPILHTKDHQIGSGLITAVSKEKQVSVFQEDANDRGTPFIEVDQSVVEYVDTCGDDCVNKMFGQLVKSDGALTAIFPFERLNHSFLISGFGVQFDPDKEREQVDVVRGMICRLKDQVNLHLNVDDEKVLRKGRHYLRILNDQLEACEKTEEMIDMLCRPFPGRSL